MAVRYADAVKNPMLDAYETAIGTAPLLRIYTGSPNATPLATPAGTLLAEMALPSDWLAAAAAGSKAKSGTWSDSSANATGTAGCYTITNTAGSTIYEDGTVTATGGGGDIVLDNVSIAAGQGVSISTFTKTL